MPLHSAILPRRLSVSDMLETACKFKLVFKVASEFGASVRSQNFRNTKEPNPMRLKRLPSGFRVISVTVAHQSNYLEIAAMVHHVEEIDLLPKKVHLKRVNANNAIGLIGPRNSYLAVNSLTRMRGAIITNKFVLSIPKHLSLDLGRAKNA